MYFEITLATRSFPDTVALYEFTLRVRFKLFSEFTFEIQFCAF